MNRPEAKPPKDTETVVWGSGTIPCRIAVVGEAPAEKDVQQGLPLVSPAGKVHWPFLGIATGLRREQCYVTNLKKQQFTEEEEREGLDPDSFEDWRAILHDELDEVGPDSILAIGRWAAAAFLGFDVKMERVHGIPHQAWLNGGRPVTVTPAFHPAAGMRDSKRLAYTLDDYAAFGRHLAGKLAVWEPKPAGSQYRLWQPEDTFSCPLGAIAIDTEFDPKTGKPLMLTFTTEPGTGFAIRADDGPSLRRFATALAMLKPTVAFHNCLADLSKLKEMEIDIVRMGLRIVDTQVLAWYQETESQGLKNLAYRKLGVDRPGFEETVTPYFAEQIVSYLSAAQTLSEPALIHRVGKRGQPLKAKPGPASRLHKLVKRFVGDHAKGRIADYVERWENWGDDVKAELAGLLGPAPEFSLSIVPDEVAIPYACSDTDDTLSLISKLKPYNEKLCDMDHRKLPMIAAMQERGLTVDMEKWEKLRDEVKAQLADRERELKESVGEDFNPRSADDIAEVLYGFKKTAPGVYEFMRDREYILPTGWTKGGKPKTDKKALGQMKSEHALAGMLLGFKELEKLDNTYVSPLPDYLRGLGRFRTLHPDFTHTRVPSGRLAARRPNIMAIPSRSETGLRIRDLFVAREGYTYTGFDHSQIELRLACHISGDPYMLSLFEQGIDLHLGTAARIGRKDVNDTAYWKSEAGKRFRTLFKSINFGILFGATAERIYLELLAMGITAFSLDEVKAMIAEWFALYSAIEREIRATERFIQQHGYVEDMWGRRRKLPGAYLYGRFWPMSALREEAVRQGFNHRIQGGAQGLIIRAMLGFWEEDMPLMREIGAEVFPLLQIHDEVIFEVPDRSEIVETFQEIGLARMKADQGLFTVPIEASCSSAHTWGKLK